MAGKYLSNTGRAAALALGLTGAASALEGCVHGDIVYYNGVGPGSAGTPAPTPVTEDNVVAHLLTSVTVPPGNYSRNLADVVDRDGVLTQTSTLDQKGLTKKLPPTGSDGGRIYVATVTNRDGQRKLKVSINPMPGHDHFDVKGLKFSYIELVNRDVVRGDIFDGIKFAVIDPYRNTIITKELKAPQTYRASDEDKVSTTLLGKALLKEGISGPAAAPTATSPTAARPTPTP